MKKKLIAAVVIVIVAGMLAELILSPAGERLERVKLFAMVLYGGCKLISSLFTKMDISALPKELLERYAEDEDYILSQNRLKSGNALVIVGGIMAGVPLIVLMIKSSVEGILAISLPAGVVIFIIGMILLNMASNFQIEITEEMLEKYPMDIKESRISVICNIMAIPAFLTWVVLFILGY